MWWRPGRVKPSPSPTSACVHWSRTYVSAKGRCVFTSLPPWWLDSRVSFQWESEIYTSAKLSQQDLISSLYQLPLPDPKVQHTRTKQTRHRICQTMAPPPLCLLSISGGDPQQDLQASPRPPNRDHTTPRSLGGSISPETVCPAAPHMSTVPRGWHACALRREHVPLRHNQPFPSASHRGVPSTSALCPADRYVHPWATCPEQVEDRHGPETILPSRSHLVSAFPRR